MRIVSDIVLEIQSRYKFIFYDPIKDQILLVKNRFALLPAKSLWVEYWDSERLGKAIREDRTNHWEYVGKL